MSLYKVGQSIQLVARMTPARCAPVRRWRSALVADAGSDYSLTNAVWAHYCGPVAVPWAARPYPTVAHTLQQRPPGEYRHGVCGLREVEHGKQRWRKGDTRIGEFPTPVVM